MDNAAADKSSLSAQDRLALTVLLHKKARITPHFDLNHGFRYPEAEEVLGLSSRETAEKLGQLHKLGYLNRTLYSTMLKCPVCGEFRLLLVLRCPHCSSMMLQRGSTLRHYRCGHFGFEDDFIREGKYVCPKCHEALEKLGVDFRKIGIWYRCLECGELFGEPLEKLNCFKCGTGYLREDCILQPIWGYEVNEENIRDVMLDIELDTLMSALSDRWNLKMFSKIYGESSIAHPFSLVLSTKGPILMQAVIDIEYSNQPVGQEAVMRFFAKTVDIKVSGSILIIVPELEEPARKLSEWYEITVLETERLNNIIVEVKQILT